MSRLFHLALILCVALTGYGLGQARGTVMTDGQVVLCGGAVIVIDHPTAPGQGRAHICPDMALALMTATATPPVIVGSQPVTGRVIRDLSGRSALSLHIAPARARDPPLRFFA